MANRRYDQFPSGTYNATDIILQADPTTGELEKIALADIPSGGFPTTVNSTRTSNTGGVMTTLLTVNVPAGTLSTNADFIRIRSLLASVTGIAAGNLRINLGGSIINIATNTSTLQYILDFTVLFSTTGNVLVVGLGSRSTTFTALGQAASFAFDNTIDNTITIEINDPTSNVMTHLLSIIEIVS